MQALATSTDRPIFRPYPELVYRRFARGELISETALRAPTHTLLLVAFAGGCGFALGRAIATQGVRRAPRR